MEPTTVKEVAFSALRDLLGEKLECESVDERSAEGLKAIAGEIRAMAERAEFDARETDTASIRIAIIPSGGQYAGVVDGGEQNIVDWRRGFTRTLPLAYNWAS